MLTKAEQKLYLELCVKYAQQPPTNKTEKMKFKVLWNVCWLHFLSVKFLALYCRKGNLQQPLSKLNWQYDHAAGLPTSMILAYLVRKFEAKYDSMRVLKIK